MSLIMSLRKQTSVNNFPIVKEFIVQGTNDINHLIQHKYCADRNNAASQHRGTHRQELSKNNVMEDHGGGGIFPVS